jgi:hypothetical protein
MPSSQTCVFPHTHAVYEAEYTYKWKYGTCTFNIKLGCIFNFNGEFDKKSWSLLEGVLETNNTLYAHDDHMFNV